MQTYIKRILIDFLYDGGIKLQLQTIYYQIKPIASLFELLVS